MKIDFTDNEISEMHAIITVWIEDFEPDNETCKDIWRKLKNAIECPF